MAHIQATGISLAYGDRDVLRDVNVNLSTADRCALSGANGSGKSSLMKILAGLSMPDSGTVTATSGARISYLPQAGISHRGRTLGEELDTAFGEIGALITQRDLLAHEIADLDQSDPTVHEMVEQHHHLEEQILHSGYYDRDATIGRVTGGLGFKPEDLARRTDEFSGGWQMRIALAKVLLEDPDFLLLDEPTNYLDLEARIWLGRFLSSFPGGVLLVSHDRRFLDETVNTIWELFLSALRRYRGTYTDYERQRQMELEQAISAWERQQEEIRRIEDFIRRFRATASKAKQVQSRVKQLDKMVRVEIPEHLKRIRFTIPPAPHSGREVITLADIGRAYGDNTVIAHLDLSVARGERVVLVGPNGAGKSTLLRVLADRDNGFTGSRRYGSGVALGYYAEDDHWFDASAHADFMAASVLESLAGVATGQNEQQLRNLLGGFLFHGDDVHKQVSVLSGGERSRIALLELLLKPLNLLILDEPTNHLDMTSKQVLLDALTGYDGTVVFVSHDRSFIESLATRVVELKPSPSGDSAPSTVTDFPGDYSYYLWKIENDEQAGERHAVSGRQSSPPRGESDQEAHKARRSRVQKLERTMEELLARIDELQARHREIQHELTDPLIYGVGASVRRLTAELETIDAEIAKLSDEWDSAEAEHSGLLSE